MKLCVFFGFPQYFRLKSGIGVADAALVGLPSKVTPSLEQKAHESIKKRKPAVPLYEQELPHFIDFQENVLPLGCNDKVKTAKDNPQLLHQGKACLLQAL